MFLFISGGARSGKSEWAERAAVSLSKEAPRVYLATARVSDEDMRRRVALHRAARAGRGFLTVERTHDLTGVLKSLPPGALVLLECLPNWAANEMFLEDGTTRSAHEAMEEILPAARCLREKAAHLLIVSDDVFSDGNRWNTIMESYIQLLGELHVRLAGEADAAVECVCGIPAFRKGDAVIQRQLAVL